MIYVYIYIYLYVLQCNSSLYHVICNMYVYVYLSIVCVYVEYR